MAVAAGSRLGSYEVVSLLGAGGMGEVYRARDVRLGREVAIKVLPAALLSDPERVARFAREARLLASLHHPGIATIHAFEEADGRHLLVMELASGEGLDSRIDRGPLAAEDAVAVARQIAEALEAAHEQGIVHRDLKPANVRLAADGRVKLLDFGLAKAMAADAAASGAPVPTQSPTLDASPTIAGVILGTAPYMAPEQARGAPVDRRADVWAFGVVLWEMLTGRRLFTGGSVAEVLANVLRQPIPVDELPATTPAPVRRLVARCLERDPKRRLRDIGEARVLLEDVVAGSSAARSAAEPADTPPPPARRLRRVALVAGSLALGGLAGWFAHPSAPFPPLRAVTFPVEGLTPTHAYMPAVSADGASVLYVAENRVRVQSLADPAARPIDVTPALPDPYLAQVAFWSPDGASVAVSSGHKLWRYPAGGGTPAAIADIPQTGAIDGGDWSAEGDVFFAVWTGDLYRVRASGGRPELLLKRGPREVDFHFPRVLPGGRGVLYLPHRAGEETHVVEVLSGGARHTVLDDGAAIAHFAYVDGRLVYDHVDQEGIWEVPFSLDRLAVTGRPRLAIADGTCPSLGRDGTLVFVRGAAAPTGELVWVGPDGGVGARIGTAMRGATSPALSPDGTRVAISYRTDEHADLWAVDLARGTSTRLTATPNDDELYPSWTPSGAVLFGRLRGAQASLGRVDAAGATEPRDLDSFRDAIRVALEPDGRHLLFMTDLGPGEIRRAAVDAELRATAEPEPVARATAWISRFAVDPRGELLAFAALQNDRVEVFLSRLATAERWQVSGSGGAHPCWSRGGDRLFYVAGDDLMEVAVRRGPALSLDVPRRLFSLSERRLGSGDFDVAADGRFLMVRQSEPPRIAVVVNGRQLLQRPRS